MYQYWILLCLLPFISSLTLLRRDLTDYSGAKCNDGTTAAYFHQKDVLQGDVMIFLPDGGDCSSLSACRKRCREDGDLCSKPKVDRMEIQGGIWDTGDNNPFSQYFKVYVHYCSSDSFTGNKNTSSDGIPLYFQGRDIVNAVVDDLATILGPRMSSLVLVGSGSGGRGVGDLCDSVTSSLGSRVRVRCVVDRAELVPGWLTQEVEGCREEARERRDREQALWNRQPRCSSSTESPTLAASCSSSLSDHWASIRSPLLVLGVQISIPQFSTHLCSLPADNANLTLAWRGGVVALAESRSLRKPSKISLFIPNCDSSSSSLLSGSWDVRSPVLGQQDTSVSLREMITSFLEDSYLTAVDPVDSDNESCPVSKSSPLTARCSRLRGCRRRYSYLGYNRRYLPPSSLFPSSYSRSCTLDPYLPRCRYGGERQRRLRLWRRVRMLQYLRTLYKKYKTSYADEYYNRRPNVVRPSVTRTDDPLPNVDDPKLYDGDYDYSLGDYYDGLGDYSGYGDYDYDYYDGLPRVRGRGRLGLRRNLLARFVKAVRRNRKKQQENRDLKQEDRREKGEKNTDEARSFADFLAQVDIDYEDFEVDEKRDKRLKIDETA